MELFLLSVDYSPSVLINCLCCNIISFTNYLLTGVINSLIKKQSKLIGSVFLETKLEPINFRLHFEKYLRFQVIESRLFFTQYLSISTDSRTKGFLSFISIQVKLKYIGFCLLKT